MAKKWRTLYDKISPDRRARIEAWVAADLAEMPLAEVRRARELTQQEIARNLEVNQAWVSKIERQTDMYVSTLRSYIKAMGGDLEIIASFSDGAVRLTQFEELDREVSDWVQAEGPPQRVAPNVQSDATSHMSIWTPRFDARFDARIWQGGDRTATTRSETPSSDTPARRQISRAA